MPSAKTELGVHRFIRILLSILPAIPHPFTIVAIVTMAMAFLAPKTPAQQKPSESGTADTKSWSGILVSSACNADEAFNESPECTKNVPGAKFALYDDTNRVMYGLEPQDKVSAHLGEAITVSGKLDGDTIQLVSIGPMAIGLAVGQKAPAFSTHDQFGHLQTLDTLKGTNGTVLLFFRSADW
jgi:hypothetical protein